MHVVPVGRGWPTGGGGQTDLPLALGPLQQQAGPLPPQAGQAGQQGGEVVLQLQVLGAGHHLKGSYHCRLHICLGGFKINFLHIFEILNSAADSTF